MLVGQESNINTFGSRKSHLVLVVRVKIVYTQVKVTRAQCSTEEWREESFACELANLGGCYVPPRGSSGLLVRGISAACCRKGMSG